MLLLFPLKPLFFKILDFMILFSSFLSFLFYHVNPSMKESCVDFVINFPNPPAEVSKILNKKKKKRTPNTQHHGVLTHSCLYFETQIQIQIPFVKPLNLNQPNPQIHKQLQRKELSAQRKKRKLSK